MSRTTFRNLILGGDAERRLKLLPSQSVDMVLTSPPYPGLRNYEIEGQLGASPSVDAWMYDLLPVIGQLGRVLKPTGSLWLNLGDAYSRNDHHGAPPKSRLLAPERLVLQLSREGWLVRNVIAWHKPNPTPSPVADRFTNAWEPLYLLTRSHDYHFDLDVVRLPHGSQGRSRRDRPHLNGKAPWAGPLAGDQSGLMRLHAEGLVGHPLGKNPSDVWTMPTARVRGFHAAFPEPLAERAIQAGCPERTCTACGQPWHRQAIERALGAAAVVGALQPGCACRATWQPGLVLDPFLGSGTTAIVAERLDRDWLGIELNPGFAALAEARIDRARVSGRRRTA